MKLGKENQIILIDYSIGKNISGINILKANIKMYN